MNAKLGVAIHGAGWVAGAHAASWLKNPHVRIASISDVCKERAAQLADRLGVDCAIRDDYDEVLRDDAVQIVDLCSPSQFHAEQGIAAAEAGKHVLVEKPIALSMRENLALRSAVAQAGVRSMTSFVLRWNPAVENVRSLIAAGAIGKPFYVEVDYWHGLGPEHHAWNVHGKRATAGSALLLAGCHAVDMTRWLIGDEVVEVSGIGNNPRGNFEFDANVVAMLKFRNGAIGKTSTMLDAEIPYSFNIDVLGDAGSIRDNRLWSKKLLPGQKGWATIPSILPDSGDVAHHPFDGEIDHFVDCILAGRESHCNIADAFLSHEVCMAIDRSVAEGGRPVRLPLA